MSDTMDINADYQIQPEPRIATSFKIEIVNLVLFTNVDLRVLFFDFNNNVIKCDYITISGSDYTNWANYAGDRDAYLFQYVSGLYNLNYSIMSAKSKEQNIISN